MPDIKSFENSSADLLRLVIESGNIGIWDLDLVTGAAVRNAMHDEIFGYPELLPEWTYDQFLEHVVPEDRERVDQLQQEALAKKHDWEFECRIKRADGQERWISAAGRPLLGPDGEVAKLIGYVIDITRTKQRETQLAILTKELNHRVRNILAMIRAMVRLSGLRAKDIGSFTAALEGRVAALTRSHELIVSDASVSMTPSAILKTEMAAFPILKERMTITSAGEVPLAGTLGQGLSLIFHELITNAIKYGAFANDDGTVTVDIATDGDMMTIEWREQGGPEVSASGEGFGSTLISQAIGHRARVDLQFPPEGARCRIDLLLSEVAGTAS